MAARMRFGTSNRWSLVVVLAFLLLGGSLAADAANGTGKVLQAIRISQPITLDGSLDEAAWRDAPAGTDFIQREPDTGKPATERTEVRVLYTSKTLYIGIVCFDREPQRIIRKEMRRDEPLWRDDAVDVVIDTFDDDRNAYLFETNPNGALTDALITDEGRNFNLQWDGVWDVAARTTDDGWSAEIEIPFTTLRFDPNARQWGFNVLRYIRRRAEQAFWAPILIDADVKRVSQYGSLTGISGVEQGWNLNVKPFVVGELSTSVERLPEDEDDSDFDAGLDLKWGIGRGLSLDLTYNTDFGETEVDAEVVNLTRFSLFFEEKREFFLENAGIFEFGPGATGGGTPLLKVFHSRRIGIDPATREEVPIDWGARLTGRLGEWNLGILDMATDTVDLGGESDEIPSTNWGAVRVTRNFGSRSSFGTIVTRTDDGGNTNLVYGLDLDYKPTDRLGFDAYLAESDNSAPGGTSDWSAGAGSTWNGPLWDWRLGWVRVGEDFDPEMGFLLRSNVYRYNGSLSYDPWPKTPHIMNLHFGVDAELFADLDGEVESELYTLDLFGLRTAAADEATLFVTRSFERLDEPFEIVPDVVIPVGEYTFDTVGLSFLTHSSRPVSVEGSVEVGDFYDGDRLTGSLTLMLRPSRFVRSETSWNVNDVELPGGKFTANVVRENLLIALSPRVLSSIYAQYNDLTELLSLNFRFNWIYKPGADLFVVYYQSWDAPGLGDLSRHDRKLIVKFTYLFQH